MTKDVERSKEVLGTRVKAHLGAIVPFSDEEISKKEKEERREL